MAAKIIDGKAMHGSSRRLVYLLGSALLLTPACGGKKTSPVGLSKCIQNWPVSGVASAPSSSLAVAAPKLAWSVELNGSQASSGRIDSSDGGPVLSNDRLAVQAGRFVYFISKDGSDVQAVSMTAVNSYPSGLVADSGGNVYFVAQEGVFSLDASGKLRWKGGDSGQSSSEFTYYDPPILGPDDEVFAVTSNQRVFAIRAADGGTIWSQPAPTDSFHRSYVVGGAGNGILVQIGAEKTEVFDTTDGSVLGSLSIVSDGAVNYPGSSLGSTSLGWSLGIAQGVDFVYDFCGAERWSKWAASTIQSSGVTTFNETVVSTSFQVDSNGVRVSDNVAVLYSSAGDVVLGPVPVHGRPLAAGQGMRAIQAWILHWMAALIAA